MQMRLGETLRVTLLGSSHGPFVGATIEGMPAGIQVNEERIQRAMSLRKTGGTYSSKRKEDDFVEWKKGVINGLTTGEVIELPNREQRCSFKRLQFPARPPKAWSSRHGDAQADRW